MTRDTAYKILTKYLTNPILLTHSLATEATMQALAGRLGGDIQEWGITGLLHDADYEKAKGHPEKHGFLLSQLEPNTIPTVIEHAIQAHNYPETHVLPQNSMDWALVCCDELTGIIMEVTQKQKDKNIRSLTPEGVKENLQKYPKEIADKIALCEEKLQIPLPEFISITLAAMQRIP